MPKRANCCRTTFFSAGSCAHVAVRRRVGRDRRIDVEAIDRRFRIGGECFARQRAVGGDDRRRQIDVAGIALASRAGTATRRRPCSRSVDCGAAAAGCAGGAGACASFAIDCATIKPRQRTSNSSDRLDSREPPARISTNVLLDSPI